MIEDRFVARILVTGAAGFIGRALCGGLFERGHRPIAGLRRPEPPPSTAEGVLLGDITPDRDWSRALRGVGIDIVVHLAQRAHSTADPAALAREPAPAALSISARSSRWAWQPRPAGRSAPATSPAPKVPMATASSRRSGPW